MNYFLNDKDFLVAAAVAAAAVAASVQIDIYFRVSFNLNWYVVRICQSNINDLES